jgi:membrane fusion protein, multidrug efflux system
MSEARQTRTSRPLFRPAALAAHRGGEQPGRPLEIVPLWTRLAELVTAAAVIAALIFAFTAELGEYAEGVAMVRREGRVVVTASSAGTVAAVEVRPGARVEAGQVLVRLDAAREQAAHRHAEQSYERALVEALRDPGHAGKRERLTLADATLRQAASELGARTIVAPQPGSVSDVRVRPGQALTLGDSVIAIESDDARTLVVAVFPGHVRPLLHAADTRLLLELDGFPDARQELAVDTVADEVIGPAEALRYLGRDREGAVELHGPVVVVEAALPDDLLVVDGERYRLFDGMQGTVEARLGTATIAELLAQTLMGGRP